MRQYLISRTASLIFPLSSLTARRCSPLMRTSFISSAIVCAPFPARRSTQVLTRKCVPTVRAVQKKLINVALAIANVNTSCRLAEKFRRLRQVLQPSNAFLLFDRHPRRVDLLLESFRPPEFLSCPEFDRSEPERQPVARHGKTRMHQNAANSVRPEATGFIPSAVNSLR